MSTRLYLTCMRPLQISLKPNAFLARRRPVLLIAPWLWQTRLSTQRLPARGLTGGESPGVKACSLLQPSPWTLLQRIQRKHLRRLKWAHLPQLLQVHSPVPLPYPPWHLKPQVRPAFWGFKNTIWLSVLLDTLADCDRQWSSFLARPISAWLARKR